jgi:hypothetical protein
MTLSNLTEDHGATRVAVMYPSADKSCSQQRLSFVDRGANAPSRLKETHRLLQSRAYVSADAGQVNSRSAEKGLILRA